MRIAEHSVLSNTKYTSQLPPAWGTLAELARLDPPKPFVTCWLLGASSFRLGDRLLIVGGDQQAQQDRAWDLWLDCHDQGEIAETIGTTQQTISNWVQENAKLREFVEPPESRQHFDVWQFPTTDREAGGQQSYFGAVPPQVMENLLWFYTEPGHTVVDLFAGSGTTVDVAKRMGRRVWAAD
jgi:hypothetical protein